MTDNTANILAHFSEGHKVHDDGQSTLPAERHNLIMHVERIDSKVIFTTDCPVVAYYCDYGVVREFTAESEWVDDQPQTFTVDAESFELLLVFENDVIANLYKIEGNTLSSQMIAGMQTWAAPALEAPRLFELPEDADPMLTLSFDSPSCVSALSAQMTLAADQEEPYQAEHLREWWKSLDSEAQQRWVNYALITIDSMLEKWEEILKDAADEDLRREFPTLTPNRVKHLALDRANLHNFLRITQDVEVQRELHHLDSEIDISWFELCLEPTPFQSNLIVTAAIDWYQTYGVGEEFSPWWDVTFEGW